VEPIFLRSQQNALPQLKKVVVVMRGKPFMADNLEQAVRQAVAWWQHPTTPTANNASNGGPDGSRPPA
jgi:uncharacterized membrane protein (UPF0182 family)